MSNAIQTISPYRKHGLWAFDDEDKGLEGEPFLYPATQMIDEHIATRGIKQGRPFRLVFSDGEFPDADRLELSGRAMGGAWYRHSQTGKEAWLCPATLLYFESFPDTIYLNAEELEDEQTQE